MNRNIKKTLIGLSSCLSIAATGIGFATTTSSCSPYSLILDLNTVFDIDLKITDNFIDTKDLSNSVKDNNGDVVHGVIFSIYHHEKLPPWASINPNTGVISLKDGANMTVGSWTEIKIKMTKGTLSGASKEFSIIVIE